MFVCVCACAYASAAMPTEDTGVYRFALAQNKNEITMSSPAAKRGEWGKRAADNVHLVVCTSTATELVRVDSEIEKERGG